MPFVFPRLSRADLEANYISIAKQAKLAHLPVLSFLRSWYDSNSAPFALSWGRISLGSLPYDLDYFVEPSEDFMLPNPHHDPSESFESKGKPTIALRVRSELLRPELFPRTRSRIVYWTPVPETPIYEYRDFWPRKYYIRSSCGHLVIQAIP